jgi:hypothetical protein
LLYLIKKKPSFSDSPSTTRPSSLASRLATT